MIPDAAIRPNSENGDYHTGRGGAGNAHIAPASEKKADQSKATPVSFADKLKRKIFGRFGKK